MHSPSDVPAKLPHLRDGPAQYQRGVDLLLGRGGLAADLGAAAAAFHRAAACGDPQGLYSSAMMHLKGIGVLANRPQGLALLEAAVACRHPQARCVLEALAQGCEPWSFPIVAHGGPAQPPRSRTLAAWRGVARLLRPSAGRFRA